MPARRQIVAPSITAYRWFFALLVFFVLISFSLTPFSVAVAATANPHCQEKADASAAASTSLGTYVPDIKLPGLFDSAPMDSDLMGKYFRAVFVYMVYVVAVLAVVMITYGGIKWVAAAGNAARINDAKDVITNAIIGLIIGLTAYLILNLINPNLLNLKLPTVGSVVSDYYLGAHVIGICSGSDQSSGHMSCGQIKEIGTENCPGDKTYKTYCIATTCSGGDQVCNITQSATSKLFSRGNGCVKTTIAAVQSGTGTPAVTADNQPIAPMNIDAAFDCGIVTKDYNIGSKCDGNKCFIIGKNATFTKSTVTRADQAANMQCPDPTAVTSPSGSAVTASSICDDGITKCGVTKSIGANRNCIGVVCSFSDSSTGAVCSLKYDDSTKLYSSNQGCVIGKIRAMYTDTATKVYGTVKKPDNTPIETMNLVAHTCGDVVGDYDLGAFCGSVDSNQCYVLGASPVATFKTATITTSSQPYNMGCASK